MIFSASATATSTWDDNTGCYGPTFVIDGYNDRTGCNFFHSKGTEGYPYVAAVMSSTNVNSVTLKSRCDANGWGHTQFTVVVRYKHNYLIHNTSIYINLIFALYLALITAYSISGLEPLQW